MSDYKRPPSSDADGKRIFSYFIVGGAGIGTAIIAKGLVTELISTMLPSADVLAMANIEVDLSIVPEGQSVTVKWRGKPLFIRHRTEYSSDTNTKSLQRVREVLCFRRSAF